MISDEKNNKRRYEALEERLDALEKFLKPSPFRKVRICPIFPIHDDRMPEEVMIYILACLSKADSLNCKLVCKRWDGLRHTVAVKRKEITKEPIVDMTTAAEWSPVGRDVAHATGSASQSSDYGHNMGAFQAIRGNLHSARGFGGAGSYAHTRAGSQAWWRVQFQAPVAVAVVRVYGRPGYGRRLQDVTVRLLGAKGEAIREVTVKNRQLRETFLVRFETPVSLVHACELRKPFPRLGGDDDTLNINAVQVFEEDV